MTSTVSNFSPATAQRRLCRPARQPDHLPPGSICLNVNNIIGPAIVAFPMIYQQAGWAPCTAVVTLVCILSALSGTMLCDAMQRIPGNHDFGQRYEFNTTVRHYWGEGWYRVSQVLVNVCLQCLNVASIIVASQVMDEFLVYAGRTIGIQYYDSHTQRPTARAVGQAMPPWRPRPRCLRRLVICLAYACHLGLSTWTRTCGSSGFRSSASLLALPSSPGLFVAADARGGAGRSRGLRKPGTGSRRCGVQLRICYYRAQLGQREAPGRVGELVPQTLFIGAFIMLIGWYAATSYPNPRGKSNILTVMNDSRLGDHSFRQLTRASVYAFNLGTIVPGIPVFSILVRYNLLTGGVCG